MLLDVGYGKGRVRESACILSSRYVTWDGGASRVVRLSPNLLIRLCHVNGQPVVVVVHGTESSQFLLAPSGRWSREIPVKNGCYHVDVVLRPIADKPQLELI